MKLNTKNLFETSSKMIPKAKAKKPKKSTISSPFVKEIKPVKNKTNSNTNSTNSNIKQKLFQNSNKKVNPFILSSEKNQDSKSTKLTKISTSKKIKINLDNLEKNENDLFEDSYINNIKLTSESDTKENFAQSKGNKENINLNFKNNQKDLGFNENIDLFKKSTLKSTIIVDNNGNNNLNLEQKKMIDNYFHNKLTIHNNNKCFNKFARPRERKISTQIYKDNNILFNKICHIKSSTIDNIDKNGNINKKIVKLKIKPNNNNKNNNLKIKKENNIEDKNKSNIKNKLESFKGNELLLINGEVYDILNEYLKEDDKNSIFENRTNFSFDSSFLGSSADDDFYQKLNN